MGAFDQRMQTESEGIAIAGNFRSELMQATLNFDASESDSRWTSAAASGARRSSHPSSIATR